MVNVAKATPSVSDNECRVIGWYPCNGDDPIFPAVDMTTRGVRGLEPRLMKLSLSDRVLVTLRHCQISCCRGIDGGTVDRVLSPIDGRIR